MGNVAADLLVHVGADVKDATTGLSDMGKSVDSAGKGFQKAGLLMGGASAAIIGGLGASVMAAASYEQSIANITALGGEFAASQKEISALALQIGADTSFSASEGAAAIGELAKAGVPLTDILNGAAMSAAQLAEAGGIAIPEAATVMSNAMNMFSLSGSDAAQIADIFAAAANASASDVSTLAQGLAQGGSAAASFGISLADTVTALSLFSNYGIQGSDAGTSLKTMLQSLANPSTEAAAKMQELGINAFDASGNFVGLENLSGQLSTALSGLTEEQRNAALAIIFGSDASRVAGILAKEGAEGFAAMSDSVNVSGAASEMAKARMNTLMGSIEQLKGSFETAMIIIGSGFTPAIKKVSDFLTKGVNGFAKLNPNVQKFIGYVAAGAAGVLALASGLSLAIGFFGPVVAGITALAAPILLVVGVLAALYIAWKTNFLGIQDIVSSAIGAVLPVIESFASFLGKVAQGGTVAKSAMEGIPEPLQNLAQVLGLVVRGAVDFYNAIAGGKGLSAAFKEFTEVLTGSKMMDALGNLGNQILGAITSIDWGSVGSALWNGFLAAFSFLSGVAGTLLGYLGDLTGALAGWVTEKAGAVEWGSLLASAASKAGDITGTIVNKLGDLTASITGWVTSKASQVQWGSLLSQAASTAGDITGVIVSKLGDLTLSLTNWITQKATAVPWGSLLSTAAGAAGDITATIVSKLGNLTEALTTWITNGSSGLPWDSVANKVTPQVSNIITKIGDLLTGLKTWYDNAINNVPWNSLGQKAGEKIGNLAQTLAPKAWELIQGLTQGIIDYGPEVGKGLLALILALPATIGYIGLTMAPKALEFIQGFVTGLGINWPLIGNWLAALPGKALAATPGLLSTLSGKGRELLTGVYNAIIAYWPTVTSWLGTIGSKAIAAVGSLLATLGPRGTELITGLSTAASNYWTGTVVPFLKIIGLAAFGAVGSLLKSLPDRGTELITGLGKAASDYWINTVLPFLGLIGDAAAGAVGDLSGKLLDAGKQLIQGLIDGINSLGQSAVDTAAGWAQSVIDATLGKLGINSPSKVYHDIGTGVIEGFVNGMASDSKYAIDSVSRMATDAITTGNSILSGGFNVPAGMFVDTLSPASPKDGRSAVSRFTDISSKGTVIYQTNHFEIKLDELQDVVEAGKFVRDIDTTQTLYFQGVA